MRETAPIIPIPQETPRPKEKREPRKEEIKRGIETLRALKEVVGKGERPEVVEEAARVKLEGVLRAIKSAGNRLDTEDIAGFERELNLLLESLDEVSRIETLSKSLRDALRASSPLVRSFLQGEGNVGFMEQLKSAARREGKTVRQIVETIETLAKRANEFRIEKSLEEAKKEELFLKCGIYDVKNWKEELDKIEKKIEKLEMERILQEEPELLEVGMRALGSKLNEKERTALLARLRDLRQGLGEEASPEVKSIEKKLALMLNETHRILSINARGIENYFLRREWRGPLAPGGPSRATITAETVNLYNLIFTIYKDDIWPQGRGRHLEEERRKFEAKSENERALLMIYKISEKSGLLSYLFHRRWMSFPFFPKNKAFLEKTREVIISATIRQELEKRMSFPAIKAEARKYQETVSQLGSVLEEFLRTLNEIRKERGKPELTLDQLEVISREEFSQVFLRRGLRGAGRAISLLKNAQALLGKTALRSRVEQEFTKSFPPLQLETADKARWYENLVRDVLREFKQVDYLRRVNTREIRARKELIEILKNPSNALTNFKNKVNSLTEQERSLWNSILTEDSLPITEERVEKMARNHPALQKVIDELEKQKRQFYDKKAELRRKLDRLMSEAERHQEQALSLGGRDIISEWREEEERKKFEKHAEQERRQRRAEEEEEEETEEEAAEIKETLRAPLIKLKLIKEVKPEGQPSWAAREALSREEALLIDRAKDWLGDLLKDYVSKLSPEDRKKLDDILGTEESLGEFDILRKRVAKSPFEKKYFRRTLKSIIRRAEIIMGRISGEEIKKRIEERKKRGLYLPVVEKEEATPSSEVEEKKGEEKVKPKPAGEEG